MKLEEVQFKLLSEIQSLPSEVALEYVQKSLKEIYEEHNWSFSYARGTIRTPALINTGTVNVTQFSTSVVVSASLKTILDNISVDDVPLIGRQFRTYSGTQAGSNFIYTITDYDSDTSTLTIDPFYQDNDNSSATFQIFKNYYTGPATTVNGEEVIDFVEYEWIYAPFNYRKLWLDRTRADLDNRDYARWNSGDPFWAVGYGEDSSNNRLFEFYPIPINERVYQALYKKGGRLLEPEESIPSSLNYDLILAKAKIMAYNFLITNYEKLGIKISPNVYLQLIQFQTGLYDNKLLPNAKKKDESLYPQSLIDLGSRWDFYDCDLDCVDTILLDF